MDGFVVEIKDTDLCLYEHNIAASDYHSSFDSNLLDGIQWSIELWGSNTGSF